MKLKITTLALASLLAVNANAVDVSWGTHNDATSPPAELPLEIALGQIRPAGLFADTYSFSLLSAMNLFNTTVSNNLFAGGDNSVWSISGGEVELFSGTIAAPGPSIDSFQFSGVTGNISYAFGALAAGSYYYAVTGDADGPNGGSYSLTSAVTAVPEPQTYALLLAGLGVVGFLAHRRRRID
jgi:PEP-CTERM motif